VDSVRPYLLRAIFEWCVDQGFTPYIEVSVDERTRVPREHVSDGRIVLNIGAEAAHALSMGNDLVGFSARFGGVAHAISIPVDRIAAIYARENGQGMAFEVLASPGAPQPSSGSEPQPEPQPEPESEPEPPHPHLVRIK